MTEEWLTVRQPAMLWEVPAFLPYVQPRLTSAAVRAAERQLGVTLPATYLAMLETQNGGYLRATWPGLPHRRLDGLGPNFPGVTAGRAWWQAPDADDEMWVPPEPGLLVPFDGEGHWDLCWDYRTAGPRAEPAVTYVDVDAEEQVAVAGSFDAFLDGLVDEVETTAMRVMADISLDTFGQILAEVSGHEIEDQGDWNHGYRELRARLGEQAWLWVSPNRVPAGFDRDGAHVVTTPETALRLPADPDCHLIVQCTPDAAAAVQAMLVAAGYWHG
ncbi:SMI1/KNR4 family protein [Dactylosporangium sp. CA-152071]|uniref:SMI1/KNR4 family protein n=1 Tax=Dactylosporangium sp. CA-152071 TaxID=3239933 RepID=UPI003D8C4B5E